MHELAGHVRAFAKNLADTHESATGTIKDMGSVYSGYSYEALVRSWARMSKSHMSELDTACKVIGTALDVAAEVIRAVKIAVLAELAALAATYSAALAATYATGGTAAMLEQLIAAAARKLCQAMEQMLIGYLLMEVMEKAIAPLEPLIDRMVHGFLYDTTADLLDVPNPNTLYLEPDEITRYADVLDQHADDILRHAQDFANKVAALTFTTEGGGSPVVADETGAPQPSTTPHASPVTDGPASSAAGTPTPSPRTGVGPWDGMHRAGRLPAAQHALGAGGASAPGTHDVPGLHPATQHHPAQARHEPNASDGSAQSGATDQPRTSSSQPQATGDRPSVTGDRPQMTGDRPQIAAQDAGSGGAQQQVGDERAVAGQVNPGAAQHVPGTPGPDMGRTEGLGSGVRDAARFDAPAVPDAGTLGSDAGSVPDSGTSGQSSASTADPGSDGASESSGPHAAQQQPARKRSSSKSGRSADPGSGAPWGRAPKSVGGRGTPWKKSPRKTTRARVTPPPTDRKHPQTPWTGSAGAGGTAESPKVFAPEPDAAAHGKPDGRSTSPTPSSSVGPDVPDGSATPDRSARPGKGAAPDRVGASEQARAQPPIVTAPQSDVIPDAPE